MNKLFLFLLLSLVIVLNSCNNNITSDDIAATEKTELESALTVLKSMGYETSGYIFADDSVIVEGDIVFNIKI